MLIKSRRDFLKAAVTSVGALGALKAEGRTEDETDKGASKAPIPETASGHTMAHKMTRKAS